PLTIWFSLRSCCPRQPPRPTRCPYTTLFRSFLEEHMTTHLTGQQGSGFLHFGFHQGVARLPHNGPATVVADQAAQTPAALDIKKDRKSTRLNSSHVKISYAVFCLKKKKKNAT